MNETIKRPDDDWAPPTRIIVDGVERIFDIDDPKLSDWITNNILSAGGYPYDKKMKRKPYEKQLLKLQMELVKLQAWLQSTGERVMIVFEGRDSAGKGGVIDRIRKFMNPRWARDVALTKPTETETGQWYFQRYVEHFPTRGEFVTLDRSWYNRAGVEPVMGFCTPEQHEQFLEEAPKFEQMIVNDGIRFFKFWLNIGQETQLKRFYDRRHSLLKWWKFSPIDMSGLTKWDEYTKARDEMLERTHSDHAPWIVVHANDKKRARLAVIRRILLSIPYEGRDLGAIGKEDRKVIIEAPEFLKTN